jgi:hypothetical protein
MAFTSAAVVMPWYVSQLTTSNVIIGILPAIQLGGWSLPQLLLINFMQQRRKRLKYYRISSSIRSSCWALLAITVLLVPQRADIVLPALVVLIGVGALSGGLTGLVFYDLVGKIVERQRLSTFFSLRNFFGGIGSLAAGLVARQVIEQAGGDLQPVGILFLLTWFFTTAGFLSFALVKEPEGPPLLPKRTMREDFGRIKEILLRDPPFRRYIVIRVLSMAAIIAMPFYVVYGANVLHLPAAVVASTALALIAGTIGSNAIWGWLGARGGGWLLLVATTLLSMLPPLLALVAHVLTISQAPTLLVGWVFLALFVFLGVTTGGQEITFSVLAIEVAPVEERIIYLGFTNTLVGILLFLTPVGGLLADVVSFEALFGLAAVAAVATSVLSIAALRSFARPKPAPTEPVASEPEPAS